MRKHRVKRRRQAGVCKRKRQADLRGLIPGGYGVWRKAARDSSRVRCASASPRRQAPAIIQVNGPVTRATMITKAKVFTTHPAHMASRSPESSSPLVPVVGGAQRQPECHIVDFTIAVTKMTGMRAVRGSAFSRSQPRARSCPASSRPAEPVRVVLPRPRCAAPVHRSWPSAFDTCRPARPPACARWPRVVDDRDGGAFDRPTPRLGPGAADRRPCPPARPWPAPERRPGSGAPPPAA